MLMRNRCVSMMAASGTVLSLALSTTVRADVSAILITAWKDPSGPSNTPMAVPGLPQATLNAAAAAGLTVKWNNPSAANGVGSGTSGIGGNTGNPVIDSAGNVTFFGMIGQTSYTDLDTGATTYLIGNSIVVSASVPTNFTNNQAYFQSSAASGYSFAGTSIIARDGSTSSPVSSTTATDSLLGGSSVPVSGIPSGYFLNGTGSTTNGNTKGIGVGGFAMSSNGTALFTSLVAPPNGPVAGTNIGATYFSGNTSGFTGSSSVTNGGSAGGVAGGLFAITSTTNSSTIPAINTSGQYAFPGTLTNVSGSIDSTNNGGLWLASSSGSSLIFQKGRAATGAVSTTPGASPAFAAVTASNTRINRSGSVLFTNTLGTGATAPLGFVGTYAPANSNQTGTLWFAPSGGSPQLLGQAGTPVNATGMAAGVNFSTSGTFLVNQQAMNNSDQVVFNAKLNASSAANFPSAAGTVTSGLDDQAILAWSPSGGMKTMYRTGVTPVPGSITGATYFKDLGSVNSSTRVNNQGHFTFAGTLVPDGVNIVAPAAGSGRDNTGTLWLADIANPGAATLIARSGDPIPGLPGAYFGNLLVPSAFNNTDMIVFQDLVTDALGNGIKIGGVGVTDWFSWTPTDGVQLLVQGGNTSYLGAQYPLSAGPIAVNSGSNGDGGTMCLNDNGRFTFLAIAGNTSLSLANNGIMVTQIPAPSAGLLSLASLGLLARRRR